MGVEQGLDEDGSNTGPLFDHLAERAIAAGLLDLASPRSQDAFQPHTLRTPSVHIRALFEDGWRWVGMYDAEAVTRQGLPASLLELLLDMRALGMQMVPDAIKSEGARPPLLHFTVVDRATQPGSGFDVLVDTKNVAMITVPPEGSGKATMHMIAQSDSRKLVQTLSARLDGLIDLYRVLALNPFQGERALKDEALGEAAFLARIVIGEGKQFWATVLDPADIARGSCLSGSPRSRGTCAPWRSRRHWQARRGKRSHRRGGPRQRMRKRSWGQSAGSSEGSSSDGCA